MATHRSARLKRTLVKLAVLALSAVALYALAGFLLAPRLIERKLEAMVGQDQGLTLAIEAAAVNPFTLTLSLNNVTLFRPESTPMLSIDRLEARVRAASVAERAWLLRDVVVARPRVSLLPADGGAGEDPGLERRASPSPGAQPGTVVSVEGALLLQPYADLGIGYAWSAERLTSDARIEFRRGLARIDADLAIGMLDVADLQNGESVLTVPSIAGEGLVLTTSPAAVSVAVARLDRPRLTLKRSSTGELHLPPGLASLLSRGAAVRDTGTRFELSGGRVDFIDLNLPAPVRLGFDAVAGTITGRRVGRDLAAAVSLRGQVSSGGAGAVGAKWLLARPRASTRITLDLQRIELPGISAYAGKVIGRRPLAGRMDLAAHLRLDDTKLDLDNLLVVEGLRFGEHVGNTTGELPLEMAVALLEDNEGRIVLSVPVARRRPDAGVDVAGAFSLALADYVRALAAAPLEHLAELTGRPHLNLRALAFAPGSAEIADDVRTKLNALKRALELRPRLGLIVYPGLDPVSDREALARQQIRLHVNLAASAGRPGETSEKLVDFEDPKVQAVLDEFAENRLPRSRQAGIARRFPERDVSRYRAVFEALVDNEEVARSALERLARYRARSIVEELVSGGEDRKRVQQAQAIVLAEPDAGRGGAVRIEVRRHDPSPLAALERERRRARVASPLARRPAGAAAARSRLP